MEEAAGPGGDATGTAGSGQGISFAENEVTSGKMFGSSFCFGLCPTLDESFPCASLRGDGLDDPEDLL